MLLKITTDVLLIMVFSGISKKEKEKKKGDITDIS